ncbi:hypothetical protein [Methanolobus vulcani]|nr:hypothetical protein [Methanolobus vulcani]
MEYTEKARLELQRILNIEEESYKENMLEIIMINRGDNDGGF